MERYDWNEIDRLVAEIVRRETERASTGGEDPQLNADYQRLRDMLRPAVAQMAQTLLSDARQAQQLANQFVERLPLILPAYAQSDTPCSRWVGAVVIDFVYHHAPAAHAGMNPQEVHLLEALAGQSPRAPLDESEQALLDRIRAQLSPDEFLVWYDYVINGCPLEDIAMLHQESVSWVEQQLQRARQKLWDAVTTDEARRTRTDLLGQSLTWLGTPRAYEHSSVAYSVADTGAVAGLAFAEEHRYQDSRGNYTAYIPCAFRWENHHFEVLGELSENSQPRCVINPDGDMMIVSTDAEQLRWDAHRGMRRLPAQGCVYGMGPCGEILVGECEGRAVRWVEEAMEWLSDDNPSAARAVSANGKVIVGHIHHQAIRWDSAGKVQRLGTLGGERSEATAVSFDGTVVVGKSDGQAFRWTPHEGMCALIPREDVISQAHGVSYDGTRIVGEATDEMGHVHAFLWTNEDELQDLNVLFAHLRGLGERLERAYAISPNGRYIVGEGYCSDTERTEAFLIDLGELSC
ncbi:MAG: hypothetical protein NZ843_03035 [Fimbriimonadales bacterium]|nr:hypothetical protein [Fimbriimonadales bacterium]